MNKIEADAVVVGAGIAGLVTALRLAEQGMKAVVLEQGSQDKYPCNTRIAGGAFHGRRFQGRPQGRRTERHRKRGLIKLSGNDRR